MNPEKIAPVSSNHFLSRLPFLVIAILLGAATVCAAVLRLTERVAINPWEPAIAMEAMRFNAGLPLYQPGHATHMYGPLLTVLLAGIFQITNLNLLAARIVLSTFALGLSLFLSAILCRKSLRQYWWLALLLFLGINFRTNLIFLSAQADGIATLFAVVALCIWIKQEKLAVAIAFFIVAMLFKQTAAAFALIPIVHALIWQRPLLFRALARAFVPTLSILLTLAIIRLAWPQMFAAFVTVPASIKVYPERALGLTFYLLATFPIFLVALLSTLGSELDDSERWILSGLVVLIPVSIWTICKSGAGYNSFFFAYLAMTALFVARLGAIFDWLGSLSSQRRLVGAIAIALAIVASFFLQLDKAALLFARCGDEKYDTAVALARTLKGVVVTPQDPTIACRANKYFGRALIFELDAHSVDGNWPRDLPAPILQELESANYVIEVNGYVPMPIFASSLPRSGFHPVAVHELDDSAYTLWARD